MKRKIITIFVVLILILASVLSFSACKAKDVIDGIQDVSKQLSAPDGLRVESGLLCWNPVEFASRYTVSIDSHEYYCDDYSYSLDGLKDGDHVFKVKANGDGVLYITSPFSEELVLTIEGGAIANSGYYGQFDELTKKESFLGYGFDVINSAVFSDKYVLTSFPIFDNESLMNQRLLKVDSKHAVVNEVQNSELSTFMQQWNASLNVNVGWDGWICAGSVDVSAKYSGGVENAESMYYHVISIENQKFYIVLQSDIETLKSIVSDGFKAALYSDMEPATLFDRYGTHFITSAVMGGKINSYYLYSSTEKKSYHDVSASVSVDVRTFFTGTEVDVSGGYRQEAKKQNINIKNSLEVIGGGDFGMLSDTDIAKNYAAWEKSLDDHASLMGIKDSGSLIPIWELFDASLDDGKIYTWDYKDEAGNTITSGSGNRAAQLQAYFYAYGLNSYNDLMKSAGLREIVVPESIEEVKINGQAALYGEYEVYAGADNAISFGVQPSNALGYTKEAFLSTDSSYASIDNKNGSLILRIDAACPHNTVLQVTLSAGTVRKQITVRVVKRFTVTFETNTDDIQVAAYQNVRYGRQIEEPTVPERVGYELNGWFTSPYLTQDSRFVFGEHPITDNITLYAKWDRVYLNVTYKHNIAGKENDVVSVIYNTKLSRPMDPEIYGYTFEGFYENSAMTVPFTFGNAVTQEVVVYVKWNTNSYTVTFDTNGGTPVDPISAPYNTKITKPITTKSGATFGNWCIDPDGKQVFDFYNEVITKDMTLYASWKNNPITVEFDSCGGNAIEPRNLEVGDSIEELPIPVKAGYTFIGWFTDNTYTKRIYDTTTVNESTTLYAKWEANDYTVIFDANGGNGSMNQQTFTYDKVKVLSSNLFTRQGYEFLGWAKSADGADEYPNAGVVDNLATSGNVTLYAVWKVDPLTIGQYVSSGKVSDTYIGGTSYYVYNTIDKTPCLLTYDKVIIDWSNATGSLDILDHNGREKNDSSISNNIVEISSKVNEVYFIGDPNKTFENLYLYLSGFVPNQKLTINFVNFNYKTNKANALGIAQDIWIDLTMNISGKCSIGSTYSGGNILGLAGSSLTVTGAGKLTLTAGNGSDATTAGGSGSAGGNAIETQSFIVKMDSTGSLTAIGGCGGDGMRGVSYSTENISGFKGGDGGNGGKGGVAIKATSLTIDSYATIKFTGGRGGYGGGGGYGGQGAAAKGGNGGNGGNGGDAAYVYSIVLNKNYLDLTFAAGYGGWGGNGAFSQTSSGASGDGGNGGNGGDSGYCIYIVSELANIDKNIKLVCASGGNGGNGGDGGNSTGVYNGSTGDGGNGGNGGDSCVVHNGSLSQDAKITYARGGNGGDGGNAGISINDKTKLGSAGKGGYGGGIFGGITIGLSAPNGQTGGVGAQKN